MPATYNDLYLDARKALKGAGVEAAQLEARELLCFASGKDRTQLIHDLPLYASDGAEKRFRGLLDRRLKGEPVAYLIGEWEFYGLTLDVNESVLIPRMDTEVLAGEAIGYLRSQGRCRVLDLCAGSGCVGLAAASQAPECRVLLGEISEPAARICRQNIRRCGLTGRVSVMTLDALQPPPKSLGEFQCIVCNPPYIPRADIDALERSVKDFEPYLALCGGEDGFDFYSAIIQQWKTVLTCRGRLYFEVGIGQADTVLRMMRAEGFGDINVVPDGQNIPRVVYGTLLESI